MNRSTNLVIISGPSGAGEDSVIEGLINRNMPITRVITTVTRDMRPGEKEGKPYYFVSEEDFALLIEQNELAEWAEVYGKKYGVTRRELQRVQGMEQTIGIWKIEWHGVKTAKQLIPDILAIMISVPNIDELVERSLKRGREPEEMITARLEFTKEWLEHKDLYDYEVINERGQLENTINQVIDILRKENFPTT